MSDYSVSNANQTNTSNTSTQSTSQTSSSIMGKDDFLKLLVAQLQNQDPTSPMDSSQFVSQMADFTSLEQTQNMANAINQLVQTQSDNSLASESDMIGKTITWTQTATDDSGQSTTSDETGVISSVKVKDGTVSYVTADGQTVDPADVTEVNDGTNQGASANG